MSVSVTTLTTGIDLSGGTSSTTASFSTTANHLVLLRVVTTDGGSSPNISPANVNGLTWVNLFDSNIYAIGHSLYIGLWRAMASAGGTGTMAISHTSSVKLQWEILDFDGVNTSGTNGSGAIGSTNQSHSADPTGVDVSLPATGASNAVVGFVGAYPNVTGLTNGSGFTLLNSGRDATMLSAWVSEWINQTSITLVDFNSDATESRSLGLEIVASGGSVPTTGAPSGLVVGAGF